VPCVPPSLPATNVKRLRKGAHATTASVEAQRAKAEAIHSCLVARWIASLALAMTGGSRRSPDEPTGRAGYLLLRLLCDVFARSASDDRVRRSSTSEGGSNPRLPCCPMDCFAGARNDGFGSAAATRRPVPRRQANFGCRAAAIKRARSVLGQSSSRPSRPDAIMMTALMVKPVM